MLETSKYLSILLQNEVHACESQSWRQENLEDAHKEFETRLTLHDI